MPSARLLIVDDEESIRASLTGVLEDEGYTVASVAGGEACLEELGRSSYDVVLLDVWLPGIDGIETLRRMRSEHPGQFAIMLSGHGTIETAVQATKLGAFDFLEKPLSLEKLVLVVEHAVRQLRLEEENRTLRDFVQRRTMMIGDSVPMRALRQQIEYAAPTEGRVLIYGENGTGKELVARLLHLHSPRSQRAFVEVNCAAIPEDLIEAELFGSLKGAYTGATEDRQGKFAQADGGTIFLDEVGDMSLKTQAKVLRVLEEQRFQPVGSTEPVDVDVRVLAATNKNLEDEIEAGRFREDLFFRLNVIPFEVPPLRDRAEDIPALTEHFLEHFSNRYGASKQLGEGVVERLQLYSWPGNVRELRNTVERLVIMVPGEVVEVFNLPLPLLRDGVSDEEKQDSLWQQARTEFERDFLLRNLLENDGNVARTAAAIGMERTHLYRKLKAHRIKLK